MKFLFISRTGSILPLAMKVSGEGHTSVISTTSLIGDGFITKLDWTDNVSYTVTNNLADYIIFDDPSYGRIAKDSGFKTLFASTFSNALEQSDEYNHSIIKCFGLTPYQGEVGNHLTVEGWFNGHKIIASLLTLNYPNLFTDNIGPDVESMGSVTYGKFNRGKLYEETLAKIETPLRKTDYRGPVSIDLVVNEKGVYAKKIYAKLRPLTLNALFEGTPRQASDILLALATGEGISAIPIDDYVITVRLSIPPWPNHNGSSLPVVLTGVNEGNRKHLWFMDMRLEGEKYICNNSSGCIGFVTARGKTIRETQRRVYRTISNLSIPDVQYRTDIGRDAQRVFNELKGWKLI